MARSIKMRDGAETRRGARPQHRRAWQDGEGPRWGGRWCPWAALSGGPCWFSANSLIQCHCLKLLCKPKRTARTGRKLWEALKSSGKPWEALGSPPLHNPNPCARREGSHGNSEAWWGQTTRSSSRAHPTGSQKASPKILQLRRRRPAHLIQDAVLSTSDCGVEGVNPGLLLFRTHSQEDEIWSL